VVLAGAAAGYGGDRRRAGYGGAVRGSRRAVGLASEGRGESCRPATARPRANPSRLRGSPWSERLGHDEPGMRGVYGHVSPAMREELKAALQARWEDSLRHRAALSPVSGVPLLNQLLAGIQAASEPVRSRLAPKIGHRPRRIANRRSLDSL